MIYCKESLRETMKRGTRCVVQTINLSDPKTCVKPKQMRKPVRADTTGPYPDPNRASNCWTPRPVTINVYKRKDVIGSYGSKQPSDCAQKPPPLSSSQKLCRTLMFLTKGAVTAGLIYWTYSEGLWGDSTETEDLYYRILSTIAPALPAQPDTDDVYELEGTKHPILLAYNHALLKITSIIIDLPLEIHRKVCELLLPCSEIEEMETTLSKHSDENPAKL